MATFTKLTSRYVVLDRNDVDTDQIIPARFLKVTTKEGLERHLFADWRWDEAGLPREGFPLDAEEARGAAILVAGDNFGCGSSREHAPWALLSFGFRAIVARSFADIFCANALKNGLVPVVVDAEMHAAILASRASEPRASLTVDLAAEEVTLEGATAQRFSVDPFARHCLLSGLDELGYLLSHEKEIAAHEAARRT